MEEQEILNLETGDKEAEKLKPKNVKIINVKIEEVSKNNEKFNKCVCEVKHPDKEELVKISSVKYEVKNKLKTSGLWIKLDEDNKIRKGSALAIFKEKNSVKTLNELKDKEVETIEDEGGYLCFKAY